MMLCRNMQDVSRLKMSKLTKIALTRIGDYGDEIACFAMHRQITMSWHEQAKIPIEIFTVTNWPWQIDRAVPKGSKRHFWPFSTFHGLWHNSQ